ncbi:MAG: helix-turn-helix domain-containing protein, partial [Myxococcales bacterium]|nr:helix-turn-helix domain-containing protein [Myxococcales bacterium]
APSLADAQVQAVRQALAAHDGNVSAAARALGIARSTVYRILQRHGLG